MDTNKLILHQASMAKNLPGATKCINSVYSAIVWNISIPFTRDDLHQLYDYDKALYKAAIEKNDNFSDDNKEKKKGEIEVPFSEAEMLDVTSLSRYNFSHYNLNTSRSIAFRIARATPESIASILAFLSHAFYHRLTAFWAEWCIYFKALFCSICQPFSSQSLGEAAFFFESLNLILDLFA